MPSLINEKIESDLISGDELVSSLEKGNGKMSQSTRNQAIAEIKNLQFIYKIFNKLNNKFSRKQMLIAGLILFVVGLGLFKIGLFLEGTLPLNSYTADSTSYSYRRGQEINSSIASFMTIGTLLIASPLIGTGSFFFLKSRSQKYLNRVSELKTIISKTI